MNAPEAPQRWNDELESAKFDRLILQIGRWVAKSPAWPPFEQAAAVWARVEPRLRELQNRLNRVLVVGVVGGTGTGKSTLVNALVGKPVSAASDIQRPTTVRPVVVCHPDVDPTFLDFAMNGTIAPTDGRSKVDVVRVEAPLLSSIILIDCPDPDTQGDGTEELANRNRDLLRQVLPQCDVMLHVATAQKYKTASVVDELLAHAPGRQIIFVQTHAAVDHDIRVDWKRELERADFRVPRMFYIDSQQSIARQEQGEAATPELHALRDFLRTELAVRARHRIRRANALDLIGWWLAQVQEGCEKMFPAVAAFEERIAAEETRLAEQVRERLAVRLTSNRQLWRTWLLERTTSRWGNGPFAAFVRFVNRPFSPWRWFSPVRGALLSGFNPAQRTPQGISTIGDQAIVADWSSTADVGIGQADLAQAHSVLRQQADRAALDSAASRDANGDPSHDDAGQLAAQLGQRATAAVEELVVRRSARAAGPIFHGILELLFLAMLGFVIGRLGWNFFYEHTWLGRPLLGLDYLVFAALWVFVWGLALRWLLGARLQLGLRREIRKLMRDFDCRQSIASLFAQQRQEIERTRRHVAALAAIESLRDELDARAVDETSLLGHGGGGQTRRETIAAKA